MRISYIPIFPLLWIIVMVVQILVNYEYYMSTEQGRLILMALAGMAIIGVIAFVYTILLAICPKALYKLGGNRCSKCYSKLIKGTGFCPRCGEVSDIDEMMLQRCGRCGEKITDASKKFCPKCGNSLK